MALREGALVDMIDSEYLQWAVKQPRDGDPKRKFEVWRNHVIRSIKERKHARNAETLLKRYGPRLKTIYGATYNPTHAAGIIEELEDERLAKIHARTERERKRSERVLFESKHHLVSVGTRSQALKHLLDAWKAHHIGVKADVSMAMERAMHAGASQADIDRVMDRAARETSKVREKQYRARERVARHERGENPVVSKAMKSRVDRVLGRKR